MFIPEADYLKIQAVLPVLCVDCLIVHEGECLLLMRNKEPAKGQYWFPGGRVLKDELIRDAALRKAYQETDLKCFYERVISIEETIFEKQGGMSCGIHTVNVCCCLSARSRDGLVIDGAHDGHLWVDAKRAGQIGLHPAVLSPLLQCLSVQKKPWAAKGSCVYTGGKAG